MALDSKDEYPQNRYGELTRGQGFEGKKKQFLKIMEILKMKGGGKNEETG